MRATLSSAAWPRSCAICREGAVVGTASLRRQALVKRLRPDLEIVPLRGNVETRLRKLEAGDMRCDGPGRRRLEAARPACRPQPRSSRSTSSSRRSAKARSGSRPAPDDDADPRACRQDRRSPIPRPRSPPSAPSSPSWTAPAGRRSAAMRAWPLDAVRFRGIIVKPDGSEAFEVLREGRRDDAAALGADARPRT